MLGIAKKYKTNLTAICLTPHLNAQLPAWYHLTTEYRPMTDAVTKCLINKHKTVMVADLLQTLLCSRLGTRWSNVDVTKSLKAG